MNINKKNIYIYIVHASETKEINVAHVIEILTNLNYLVNKQHFFYSITRFCQLQRFVINFKCLLLTQTNNYFFFLID